MNQSVKICGGSLARLGAVAALLLAPVLASAQEPPCIALAPTQECETSILVFPLYDAGPGAGTVLCVTNTNTATVYCPATDSRVGEVLLHYLYIDGDTCLEFDRYELLTPGDTLCVIASEHDPESDRGFLVVSARNPLDATLIASDTLIGSAVVVQSDLNMLWSYSAWGLQSLLQIRPQACDEILDPDAPANGGDGDGVPDFDNIEYVGFTRQLFVDSFFEEGGTHGFTNQLTLMSTSGQDYINELNVLIWNNQEQKYSRTFKFTCWFSGALSEISSVAANLGGDEEEIGHGTETGWVRITGNRILDLAGNPVKQADGVTDAVPAMLGVFAQALGGTDFASGRGVHLGGEALDGMEIEVGDGDPQGGD